VLDEWKKAEQGVDSRRFRDENQASRRPLCPQTPPGDNGRQVKVSETSGESHETCEARLSVNKRE
jgi:hypothetical protein